jgi:hypothetical protein
MEKIGFLHSYCTASAGAGESASGAGDLKYAQTRGAYWSSLVSQNGSYAIYLAPVEVRFSVQKRGV